MRREKQIEVGGRKVTVRELRVKDIRRLLEAAESLAEAPGGAGSDAGQMLQLAAGLTMADCDELTPGELRGVWEAVKEVNADFLSLAESLGVVEALKNSLRRHLTASVAGSSSEGT